MHDSTDRLLIAGLWLAWLLYWYAAASNVKSVQRRETALSRMIYTIPLVAGAALMFWPRGTGWLFERFVAPQWFVELAGLAILAAGLAFTVWARLHLGRNWSGTVTLKQDHELIRTGPYRFVRHPIYTGLLVAVFGTALALGQWRGLIALALIAASFLRKMRIEEQFLRDIFPDAYERYRAEVRALIPFVY